MTTKIAQDTLVELQITMKTLDGQLIDETGEDGVAVAIGHDDIFAKAEESLMGHKAGDRVRVLIEPEDGFGEFDENLIRMLPPDALGDSVQEGMKVEGIPGETSDGRIYTIKYVGDDGLLLDANHELAGSAIALDMKVLSVRALTEDEIASLEQEAGELFEVSSLTRDDIERHH